MYFIASTNCYEIISARVVVKVCPGRFAYVFRAINPDAPAVYFDIHDIFAGELFGGGAGPVDFEGVGGHGPDEGEAWAVDHEDAGAFGRVDGLNQRPEGAAPGGSGAIRGIIAIRHIRQIRHIGRALAAVIYPAEFHAGDGGGAGAQLLELPAREDAESGVGGEGDAVAVFRHGVVEHGAFGYGMWRHQVAPLPPAEVTLDAPRKQDSAVFKRLILHAEAPALAV